MAEKKKKANKHPRITVSDDVMTAVLSIPANKAVSLEQVKELVALNAICVGILPDAIKQATEASEEPRHIILARGTPPEHGHDGFIEYKVETEVSFEERADGSLNYWESASVKDVSKGQWLAEYTPATLGKPGIDIRGNNVLPDPGKDLDFKAISGAGTGVPTQYPRKLIAAREGVLDVKNGVISVRKQVLVEGNVDLKVGNIETNYAVTIEGDIRAGFAVKSEGDIRVNGVIEDGRISARGDVIVGGGILAGEERIKAHGDIIAMFIHERVIKGSHVQVGKGIRHATIMATGSVLAHQVMGGSITCGGSLEVIDLGSSRGDPTFIQVGLDPYRRAMEIAEAQRVAEEKAKQLEVDVHEIELDIPLSPKAPEGIEVVIHGELNPPVEVWIGPDHHWKVNSPTSNVVLRIHGDKIIAVPGITGKAKQKIDSGMMEARKSSSTHETPATD